MSDRYYTEPARAVTAKVTVEVEISDGRTQMYYLEPTDVIGDQGNVHDDTTFQLKIIPTGESVPYGVLQTHTAPTGYKLDFRLVGTLKLNDDGHYMRYEEKA